MAQASRREAYRLEAIKQQLFSLADLWKAGQAPEILQKVTTRAPVEDLRAGQGSLQEIGAPPPTSSTHIQNVINARAYTPITRAGGYP